MIGSLFSGIGGLDLGLEACGLGPVIWQCDSDPCARIVLGAHWPGVKRYEDVRDIDGRAERPDIICGGFPCQDISNAGRRAGITGERSSLWFEFARVIRDLRPRVVFVENVAALANRGLDAVLGSLAKMGFDAEWGVFSAAETGAPHRRERLFILAYADGAPREWARDALAGTGGEEIRGGKAEPGRRGRDVADPLGQGELQPEGRISDLRGWAGNGGSPLADADGQGLAFGSVEPARPERQAAERGRPQTDPWAVEPDVGRVAHGVPSRVDRLRLLGNSVVPQQAALAFRSLIARAA